MELSDYLLRQRAVLAATPAAAVAEGRIDWEDVPSWQGVKAVVDGHEGPAAGDEASVDEGEDEEEGEWREALANTGKAYYWNVRTLETRWDKPSESTGMAK